MIHCCYFIILLTLKIDMIKSEAHYGSINKSGATVPPRTLCTVFQTSSNIITVITGAGMLSLPFAAAFVGWLSVPLIVLIASIFFYTYTVLADVMECMLTYSYYPECETIDYFVLAKHSFGEGADKVVMCILFLELLLAMVSFFINIGTNLHLLLGLKLVTGILSSVMITALLSVFSIKQMSYFTSVCNLLTSLTVISLFMSVAELPGMAQDTEYFDLSGIPVALGLICFCFGGHGAFPKIYQHMAEPHRCTRAITLTAGLVVPFYIMILAVGYYGYGASVQAVVTENIGRSLGGTELPNGTLLRLLAAIGIVCNLQVTAPIILFTLRDLLHSALNQRHSPASEVVASTVVLFLATVLSLFLRDAFAFVCGLVGSLTTMTNSVVLPIFFFHKVCGRTRPIPLAVTVLHGFILAFAALAAISGTGASLCGIFTKSGSGGWTVCRILLPHSRWDHG